MKRILSLALGLVLLLSLTALAEAGGEPDGVYTFEYTGVRFNRPESWEWLEGSITEAEDYGVMKVDTGFKIGYLLYRPVTQQQDDEMAQFIEEKNGQFTELEIETIQGYYSQSLPLFFVIGIRDGQDFDQECAVMTGESEPFSAKAVIGQKDGYTYYVAVQQASEERFDGILIGAPEEIWQEIEALQEDVIDHPEYFTIIDSLVSGNNFVPEGEVISFETTDLDGNPVSSAELFAGSKVTLLNIWRTWCGVCVAEFPELDEINERFRAMGGQVVTYCADIDSDEDLARARELTDGFNFVKLAGHDGVIRYMGTPFTYFVDSEGRVLDYPVQVKDVEQYIRRMEGYLNGETPEPAPESAPAATAQTAMYVIYVVDQHGDPVPGASLTFCTPASCKLVQTDESGTAVFEGEAAAYHVSVIDLPDGYSSDDRDDIYTETKSSGKTLVVTKN